MHITLSIPKNFRGAISVFEDPASANQLTVDPHGDVIVPIPPSGELRVVNIPFSQQEWTGYEAQWSDGTIIPDGKIQKPQPDKVYFYYMFVPNRNPRIEYFFI